MTKPKQTIRKKTINKDVGLKYLSISVTFNRMFGNTILYFI